MSVSVSVCPHETTPLRADFREIWSLRILWKSVEKVQVLLKSDKNNEYFTQRPTCVYDVSLDSSQEGECFRKSHRKSKYIFYAQNIFPRKYCRLWDNVAKYSRARQATDDNIKRHRKDVTACRTTKARTYTLTTCNTYSTATMVTRTRLQCYVLGALPVLFQVGF